MISASLRFLGGLVAGGLLFVAGAWLWWEAAAALHAGGLTVTISGAAASAQGASVVLVRTERTVARLTCRGECDDLRLDAGHGAVMAIDVLDAHGRRLAYANPNGKRPWRVRDRWALGDRIVHSTSPEPRGSY